MGERCPVLPRYLAGGICVWKPSSGVRKGFHPAHLGPGVQVATFLLSSTCDRWPLAPPGPGPEQGQVSPPARGSQLTSWGAGTGRQVEDPRAGDLQSMGSDPSPAQARSPTFWARGLSSQEVEGTPARCLGLMSLPFASGMGEGGGRGGISGGAGTAAASARGLDAISHHPPFSLNPPPTTCLSVASLFSQPPSGPLWCLGRGSLTARLMICFRHHFPHCSHHWT